MADGMYDDSFFLQVLFFCAKNNGKKEISSFNNYGENGVYKAIGEYEVAYGSVVADVTQIAVNADG